MNKIAFLLLIALTLFSKEIKVKEGKWELLGALDMINMEDATSDGCIVHRWDGEKWLIYSKEGKQEIKTINPAEGFWAAAHKQDCTVSLSANHNGTTMGETDSADMSTSNMNDMQTVFNSITVEEETMLEDTQTKLQWVNSALGCKPYFSGMDEEDAKSQAHNFCINSTFAQKSDWRLPTATEVSEFLVKANKHNETLYYTNMGCPRLVGLDMKTYSSMAVNSSKLVTINTHNKLPVGEIKPWNKLNFGARCVR